MIYTKKKQESKLGVSTNTTDKVSTSALLQDVTPKLSRHCIGTVKVKDVAKLTDSPSFIRALQSILKNEGVQCLGYVNHDFDNDSFTTVVALAESHISVHTWPERQVVQLDVFLCNYMNDNTQKCQRIFDAVVGYFDPLDIDPVIVERL